MASGKIIKFTGSSDEDGRDFLKRTVRKQKYRFRGSHYSLSTKGNCDSSLFKDDTGLSLFKASRNPDAPAPKYAMAKACVSVKDFLKAQALMKNQSYHLFKKSAYSDKIERAKKGMKKGHTVPIPVLEFQLNGDLNRFQEGRHRALAAKDMDKKYFPVYLAKQVR